MSVKTGFFDHIFGSKPFMARTDADQVYTFKVKVQSLEIIESDTPWSDQFGLTVEAKGEFKEIEDKEGDEFEEEGEHVVPFWACPAFQEAVIASEVTKGWLEMEYQRSEATGVNRDGKEVQLSGAAFRVV